MEQAQANLAAREQQLRRDRDLAETLAQLALDQQAAHEAIGQAAEQLEKLGDPGSAAASPLDFSKQLAAAQALQEAQQDFAASQTATGEGAAEVSGQQQVANQPIREGLETASMLNQSQGAGGRQPPSEARRAASRRRPDPAAKTPARVKAKGSPVKMGSPAKTANKVSPLLMASLAKGSRRGQPSQLGTGMVPNSPQATRPAESPDRRPTRLPLRPWPRAKEKASSPVKARASLTRKVGHHPLPQKAARQKEVNLQRTRTSLRAICRRPMHPWPTVAANWPIKTQPRAESVQRQRSVVREAAAGPAGGDSSEIARQGTAGLRRPPEALF